MSEPGFFEEKSVGELIPTEHSESRDLSSKTKLIPTEQRPNVGIFQANRTHPDREKRTSDLSSKTKLIPTEQSESRDLSSKTKLIPTEHSERRDLSSKT